VAKLVSATACYGSSLCSNPDISQKYKMGDTNNRSGQNTLAAKKIYKKWMRSSRVIRGLIANAKVATVLGSIPASSDIVDGI
jgi:hypothetical protein